ncbi:glutamate receptor ionotropic, NMDA 2B-like [Dreissena polymorpha]|uniref:glutamate receptor ionotropic, NMDA 2B-like n=1 Tax=Dreissena polymorpha TaxID=45954 RepID=UPI002263FF88|nr:glutamate receptor ionotropic, NMDA 2B-like [Dreissena polymorpha]
MKQDVVLQIVIPHQTSAVNKYENAHANAKQTIKHGRESDYNNLRKRFSINTWLNFTDSNSPKEILNLFCKEIFAKHVNAILSLNYGTDTASSNNYIMKLAENLGYPVISWDPNYPGALEMDQNSRVLQIAPTINHQCEGMHRILSRYNWTDFAIVTTKITSNDDFISCMRSMVTRTSVTQGYTTTAQSEEALDIMDVAKEMGLTGQNYMWLLTSASMGEHIGRSTKFPLGLLGILYNNSQEVIETAIETSVKLWALGLEALAKQDLFLDQTRMYPENTCATSRLTFWRDGDRLYRAIKGITLENPPVSFTDNGIIENVALKIYNSRPLSNSHSLAKLGSNKWIEVGDIVPKKNGDKSEMTLEMNEVVWPGGAVSPPKGRPEKRFFRIVTLKEEPYIMYVPPDAETGKCTGYSVPCKLNQKKPDDPEQYMNATIDEKDGMVNYCCTGLCVDLLKVFSEKLMFDYELYEVRDGLWGIKNEKGDWNGLVKEMQEKKADMVITSIKITHQRSTAMDFSTPFLETGITILVALRKGAISATAFLEPYDFPSWCLILVFSVHASGSSIFIFEWLSPSGLDRGRRSLREHKFSLFRSFWLIWAMLFGASVSTDNPRGMSSRFLANVWALFALVFLASYTANLAAFMITIDEYYDLSGIQDWRLANPTAVTPHFKFATLPGGSTEDNIRMKYPRMHRYMQKYNKTSVDAGIRALLAGEIHAFIYDATVLEYESGRAKECDLLTVGKWYAMTGYGVGFPKGSLVVGEIDKIILDLQRNGELDRLQKFWLAGACHSKKDKKNKTSNKIGVPNFTSAFILLASGVTLATVLMLLEHAYFKFGRRCLKKYDKTGCCALVSLSMGKSLTFEQSVIDTIDFHKRHRCKDPICETQLWKAKHELDLALFRLQRMKDELLDKSYSEAENIGNLSDSDKKRLHFRRSPSYTNAISVESDNPDTPERAVSDAPSAPPPIQVEISHKRLPSYSQAVDMSPVIDKRDVDKSPAATKSKYFEGKYYVGVTNQNDDSEL